MTRFLAIGECMAELASQADGRFTLSFAGDTFNTAWYMRRLCGPEIDVGFLSAIGDDEMSDNMAAFMRQSGIRAELTVREGRGVGLYMITLSDGERRFSYWRSASAARTLADDLDVLPGLGRGDIAHASGITLAILPPEGRARLLSALATARGIGVRIAFDTNLRPRLWESEDEMRRWTMKAAGLADFALPSFDDEATHFGDPAPEATAARYLGAGAGVVVVKDGPGPVLIAGNSAADRVTPQPALRVVDTTAAGDSFNAGFLAALEHGASLTDAARAGADLASKVIGARGALVPV